MIASSKTAKALSFILSTVVLVGGMVLAAPPMKVEIEGGGETAAAKMGTSFEDMAVGTLTAEPAEDIAEAPAPAETVETVTAEQTVQPQTTPSPQITPTVPAPDAVVAMAAIPLAPTPLAAAQPTMAPQIETPTITAQDPASAAPPQSVRPTRRDPEKAAAVVAARPKPQKVARPAPARKKPAAQPRGNAKRNNTQGAANGSDRQAKATSQGTTRKKATQSGNAAVSNYPGQVMRRISRVSKPRVKSRGTAVIAFSIGSGGGLARVSVARSSGSSALDAAAVNVIRKAAPFPAPPRGAKRQFSIRIKGR